MLSKEESVFLFNQGTYYHSYEFLGCHYGTVDGVDGAFFRVWAPRAKSVCVVGDFNNWTENINKCKKIGTSGVWETFVPNTKKYDK